MNTVKITLQDGKILMDQDYEFVVSDDIYFASDLTPYKEVRFNWNLDLHEMIAESEKEEEILHEVAEKLKKDFISFMKRKSNQLSEANFA